MSVGSAPESMIFRRVNWEADKIFFMDSQPLILYLKDDTCPKVKIDFRIESFFLQTYIIEYCNVIKIWGIFKGWIWIFLGCKYQSGSTTRHV